MRIKNRYLYFIRYILLIPFREFWRLVKGIDLQEGYRKFNYPKAWFWLAFVSVIIFYIAFRRIEKYLLLLLLISYIWKIWDAGHWKHEYSQQLLEEKNLEVKE